MQVPPGKICLKFQTPHGDAPFLVPRGTPLLSILDKIRDKLLEKGVLRGAEVCVGTEMDEQAGPLA